MSDDTVYQQYTDAASARDLIPTALTLLSRSQLLQYLQDSEELNRVKEVRTRRTVIGPGKHWSHERLEDLKPVTLAVGGGLMSDQVGRGRVLLVRIVSKCVRLGSVQLVVEDTKGRVCPVNLYHIPKHYTSSDLNSSYPLGSYFAIKEPSVRSTATPQTNRSPYLDEGERAFCIRIDSPRDFVRLSPSSFLLQNVTWPNNSSVVPKPRTALQYKDQGNLRIGAQQWLPAIESYTYGIEMEEKSPGKLRAILYGNRAQALLKQGRPGAALRDCVTALSDPLLSSSFSDSTVDILRRKIAYRAALAEYQLQRFKACRTRLTALLSIDNFSEDTVQGKAMLALLERTESRITESTTGIYDWPTLFRLSAEDPSKPLDTADYTGDMMIPTEIPGKGRGLVATRDIEPGELLLVARPLASAQGSPNQLNYLVGVNLFTESMDPYCATSLVSLLIEKMVDDPSNIPLVHELHPGPSSFNFDPPSHNSGSATNQGFDPSRLEGISTFNSFHPESLLQKTATQSLSDEKLDYIHAPAAIYHFPSFLNHSCIGNISYGFISNTIFFRCRTLIKEGEELVDSYVDALEGLEARRDKLGKHGFVCTCTLCSDDEKDGTQNRTRREVLREQIEQITDDIYGEKKPEVDGLVEIIRKILEELESTHAPNRKYKPSIYHCTRLLAATLANKGQLKEAIEVEMRGLRSIGARFELTEAGRIKLLEVSAVGDVNGILSCLFIAGKWKILGEEKLSRDWISLAKRLEKGQAGEEIFEIRFEEAARKNGLVLRPQFEELE